MKRATRIFILLVGCGLIGGYFSSVMLGFAYKVSSVGSRHSVTHQSSLSIQNHRLNTRNNYSENTGRDAPPIGRRFIVALCALILSVYVDGYGCSLSVNGYPGIGRLISVSGYLVLILSVLLLALSGWHGSWNWWL